MHNELACFDSSHRFRKSVLAYEAKAIKTILFCPFLLKRFPVFVQQGNIHYEISNVTPSFHVHNS